LDGKVGCPALGGGGLIARLFVSSYFLPATSPCLILPFLLHVAAAYPVFVGLGAVRSIVEVKERNKGDEEIACLAVVLSAVDCCLDSLRAASRNSPRPHVLSGDRVAFSSFPTTVAAICVAVVCADSGSEE